MSCEASQSRFCAAAGAEIAQALGCSAALAGEILETIHELARARAEQRQPVPRGQAAEARMARLRALADDQTATEATAAVFAAMAAFDPPIRPPAHAAIHPGHGVPLPKMDARHGWLAVKVTIDAARAGQALPPLAVEVLASRGVVRCRTCGRYRRKDSHACAVPMPTPLMLPGSVRAVVDALAAAGGRPVIAGGAVRDTLAGHEAKDLDVEVYGLNADQVVAALGGLGAVNAVGRSFGVIKVRTQDDEEVDVALPRRESKSGQGHRGFLVEPDPTMTPREAAARRDFTWNAMMMTPEGELFDFFGGRQDLADGIIRHTSPAFVEDPLRVLRAMQFAARFHMRLAPETAELCQQLLPEAAALAKERFWGEWLKLALKGKKPSAGLRALKESGWIALYLDLAALDGSPQDQIHHPEGDVLTHTMHVADAAARLAAREGMDDDSRAVLIFAAITHDLAKPQTLARRWETAPGTPDGAPPEGPGWERDEETPGQWRRERLSNHGHEEAGEPLAAAFLESIGAPKAIIDRVRPLVRCHLRHMALVRQLDAITEARVQGEDVGVRQRALHRGIRRLAVELGPVTLEELRWLVAADNTGRGDLSEKDPMAPILEEARRIGAGSGRPEPVIKARDLIAAGIATPGPALGALHRQLYQAQLDGEITTPEEAIAWARARAA